MTLAQWISIAIFALWPIIYVLVTYIFRIPEMQRMVLEQSAPRAVQSVEQQKGDINGQAKKQLAIASIAKSFKAAHLPLLPEDVVSDAIESVVLLLPPKSSE